MITLTISFAIFAAFLWIIHYIRCIKKNISINPFDEDPNIITMPMVIFIILSIALGFVQWIIFCMTKMP
jgi:hypothetical protein